MAASAGEEGIFASIAASVDAMAANLEDIDLFLDENERFHELVAAAAGNPVFTLLTGCWTGLSTDRGPALITRCGDGRPC